MVAGPTAVGKTEYAIGLAQLLDGEIVSADSMQLYKYMDIGSAKPTRQEQEAVPHHLVDEIDPREPFSAYEYQKRAKEAIRDIFKRKRVPVISGGTGLYINSLIYEMDFSAPPASEDFRKKMEKLALERGHEALHQLLKERDPLAAERIHPNNVKKVIRALEILEGGSDCVREFRQSFVMTKDYEVRIAGLTRDREELYDRINRRVDSLMRAGLVDEVKKLCAMGLTEQAISMRGIGYKEIFGYLAGEYDLEEAVRLVKRNTRHYAKRQMTWLRRYEPIRWFDLSVYEREGSREGLSPKERVCRDIAAFYREG